MQKTNKEKILGRFNKLYEDGRKNKAPQSYVDYFKARKFLLDEIFTLISKEREDIAEELYKIGMGFSGGDEKEVVLKKLGKLIESLKENKI